MPLMHSLDQSLLEPFLGPYLPWLYQESFWWMCFGLLGNITFSARFFVQWLISEKKKQLVVPPVFWHLSFWGSVINLIYALHVDRLPIILGVAALPFLYARNLTLLRRAEKTQA